MIDIRIGYFNQNVENMLYVHVYIYIVFYNFGFGVN